MTHHAGIAGDVDPCVDHGRSTCNASLATYFLSGEVGTLQRPSQSFLVSFSFDPTWALFALFDSTSSLSCAFFIFDFCQILSIPISV